MDEIKFGMRVRRYARSALERQILESVMIQEERKNHLIMNSRSEYNRCSLPRLTARLGMKEYDKEKMKQQEEGKQIEAVVRQEIGRRKKEKCQNRKEESHPEEWNDKDRETQIGELKKEKEVEKSREEQEYQRKEKARLRKRMWKDWRSTNKDNDKTLAEDEKVDFPGEEDRDSPGQGNSLHKSKKFPEKLGGEQLEWRGAYQKISGGKSTAKSTAPCDAGPLDHQGVRLEEEDQLDRDEVMRMEILLGMEQEEGTLCLLCLLPRCICHITMDLVKLDLRLRQLEAEHGVVGDVKDGDEKMRENPDINNISEAEGDSSGLLEGEGLTSQEPAEELEVEEEQPPPTKDDPPEEKVRLAVKNKEGTSDLMT